MDVHPTKTVSIGIDPYPYANSAPKRSPATNFFGFGQHRHGFTSDWVLKRPNFCSAVELYPRPKHSPFQYSEDNVPARFPQVGISTPSFLGDPVVQREAPSSYSIFWLGVPLQDLRGVTTLSHVANNPTIEKNVPLVGYQTGACFTIRVSTASFGWYPFFLHGPLADIGTPLHIHFTNGTIW